MSKKIFLFAGEQSGDAIGHRLVSLIKSQGFICYGVGGTMMKSAGMECIDNIENFQFMGYFQVFKNLPILYLRFFKIRNLILKTQPNIVIFIDYPSFSLKMSHSLKKANFAGKIIQYVCPSIWAWKSHRKETLEKNYDTLFTLFEFEKDLFKDSSLKTIWCGHPLALVDKTEIEKTHLIIYPGSRKGVVQLNLKDQIKAAEIINKELDIPIGISCSRPSLKSTIQSISRQKYPIFTTGEEKNFSKLAIATSGTITIELALRGVPTVVSYKVRLFDGIIARYLLNLKLKFYCIVNIILEREVYKEFMGAKIDYQQMASTLKKYLGQSFPRDEFKNKIINKNHDHVFLEAINSLL